MNTLSFRLNPIEEASFQCCKNYLQKKENEFSNYTGIPARKIKNKDVLNAAVSLLWEQARQEAIKQNNC